MTATNCVQILLKIFFFRCRPPLTKQARIVPCFFPWAIESAAVFFIIDESGVSMAGFPRHFLNKVESENLPCTLDSLVQGCQHFFGLQATFKMTKSKLSTDIKNAKHYLFGKVQV